MRMINADLIQYEPMLSAKGNGMYEDVMVAYKSQIDDLPTIEERKKGKWIHTDTQAGYDINGDLVWADMMKCETCGFEIDVIQGHIAQYNYCPSCGAKLEGESD